MNLEAITLQLQTSFLHKELVGGRIDKIYQPNRLDLLIQIRNKQKNILLYATCSSNNPHMRIIDKQPENPDNPPPFCMLLRKHLESGRIAHVSQPNLDRNIVIDIDTIGQANEIVTKQLIFELTGKSSNIIFVNNKIILDAIKHVGANVNKFRQILPNKEYFPPPPQTGLNILTTPSNEIIEQILKSPAQLLKALIQNTIGIGPITAKEIIWRSGLPADIVANSLDKHDAISLQEALESIISISKEEQPTINLAISEEENKVLSLTHFTPEHLRNIQLKTFDCINQAIEVAQSVKPNKTPENIQLSKFLKNEIIRTEKKLTILQKELTTATKAEQFRNIADNLMANLDKIPKSIEKYQLVDLYTNENILIELQAQLSPLENANRYYKLYNKAKRAVEQIEKQIKETIEQLDYLNSIENALQNCQTKNEINEIKTELINIGLLKEKKSTNNKNIPTSMPLKLVMPSGAHIYVGKNNKQNDLVTFKIGKTNDLWFHTKNIPGSHVILQTFDKTIEQTDIQTAATLAAWFSKACNSSNVPVDYTARKNVKKPSGAKPGFVIYEKQQTISVTTEENIINTFLHDYGITQK